MDENASNSPAQNTSSASVPPLNQSVQNVPVQDQGASAVAPEQPAAESQVNSPKLPEEQSTRITLDDLYGPSQPHELQQAASAAPQQAQEPIAPEQTQPTESVAAAPVQPTEPLAPPAQQVAENAPVLQTAPQEELGRRSSEPAAEAVSSQPQSIFPQETAQSVPAAASGKEVVSSEEAPTGGGFHFPSIMKFLIGGIVVLLLILVVWGVSSLLLSGKGQSGKVDLVYWGLWEDKNVMQPILDDFHKQHPDITVTYVEQDPKDYTKRLLTRMQEGSGPDIFRMHNTWVYPLQSILLPLSSSIVDAKKLETNYPPVVSQDLVKNGAIYALPLEMDTLSLFVNTDIFSHAGATVPTTWDNFITVAKALTVKDPSGKIQTAGASLGTFDNVSHAPDIVSLLLLQNGANLEKLNNSSNASDALSFYTAFASGDGNVWDNTLDNSLLAFSRGKVAMYFGYSYDVFAIQAANPSLKFTVHPVPHLPGRDMTIASYWAEAISNRSKHQKEAMEFMQYLAQKDTQAKLYTEETKTRAFGELYADSTLSQGLSENPLIAPFITQAGTAVSSFFVGDTGYDEYNGALSQYLGNAVNSMLKDTSAVSALTTLSQGVSQVLNNFAPSTQ